MQIVQAFIIREWNAQNILMQLLSTFFSRQTGCKNAHPENKTCGIHFWHLRVFFMPTAQLRTFCALQARQLGRSAGRRWRPAAHC